MERQAAVVLYVLAMVAVVVGVDILFFRHQLWPRLIVAVADAAEALENLERYAAGLITPVKPTVARP
jgi:hypothetical protein